MVWIRQVCSDKFRRDFMTRTFALIAIDWPISIEFSAVTKWSQMHPTITKMQHNMSLGSHGVYRVRPQRKFPTRLCGKNFCINCTSSAHLHRVYCSNETIPNAPKHYEMQQNMSLESNGVDRVRSQRKDPTRLHCMNFCISETVPSAPKHYETH